MEKFQTNINNSIKRRKEKKREHEDEKKHRNSIKLFVLNVHNFQSISSVLSIKMRFGISFFRNSFFFFEIKE